MRVINEQPTAFTTPYFLVQKNWPDGECGFYFTSTRETIVDYIHVGGLGTIIAIFHIKPKEK